MLRSWAESWGVPRTSRLGTEEPCRGSALLSTEPPQSCRGWRRVKGRGRSPHLGTGPFHTLLSRLLGGTRMEHSGNTNGKVPKLVPKGPDGPAGDAEPVILASPRQGPAASPGKARLESGNGRSSWGLSGRPGPQSQAGRGVSEKPPLQTPGGPRARSPQHLTSGVSPLPRRQSKIQNPQFWQISGPSRTRKAAEISG